VVEVTDFIWPSSRRAAVAFTFDVDGETVPHLMDRARAPERLSFMTRHQYGPNVGLGRILELLDLYGIKGTFFVPGFVAELHPEGIEAIVRGGHAIGHHGYMHEAPVAIDEDYEEEVLAKGVEVLERVAGRRPSGYRAPGWDLLSRSPALLVRHGFSYDSSLMGDDIPYRLVAGEGDLTEMPIHWISDDYAQFGGHFGIQSPSIAFDIFSQEFDALYDTGGLWVMTMHPFVSGRPSRLDLLERLIQHVRERARVWVATLDEIDAYCRQEGVRDRMPVTTPDIPAPRWLRP
jgi:peptidoglycan-N-acetylglucosamine deacetylase